MDAENGAAVKADTATSGDVHRRAVDQLRVAATGYGQTDAHRQWIRAATRC